MADSENPQQLLTELNKVRALTRSSLLTANWRLFVVWGFITLGSVFIGAFEVWDWMPWYWAIMPFSSFMFQAKAEYGTARGPRDYWLIGGAIFLGAWASVLLLPGIASIVGTWLSMVIGFAGFAMLERQRLIAFGFVGLAIWGLPISIALGVEATVYMVLMSGLGTFLIGMGVALRTVRADG